MQNYIVIIACVLLLGFIAFVFYKAKDIGMKEQQTIEKTLVIEENEKDKKIMSRANDEPSDLLERMRTEND